MATTPETGISRRRVLVGLALVAPASVACAGPARTPPDDPLVALAAAARADAALAAAAISTDPALAERVQPLLDARTQHAAALDAEVLRLGRQQGREPTTPTPTPAPPGTPAVGLADVRTAARASADAAAAVALELPADRIGLVASVAACCAGYATMLT